jgi:dTDP-glucose 4,6-dehydratase
MGNILITGSAGFVASNLIDRLLMDGRNNLIHVDMLIEQSDAGYWDRLRGRKYRMNVGSITKQFLSDNDITEVIHLAARSHVDNSIADPVSFTFDNTYATHKLLETCRQYGKIRCFVNVSTDEVNGSLDFDDHPFDDRDPYDPSSPYSASKAAQELIGQSYFKTFGFPIVTTRCSNNHGLRQHPEKFIPRTIKSILNKEKVKIYGNGENVRDWIDVRDHVNGLLLALDKGVPGEIYMFGGENEINNIDLFIKIYNYLTRCGANILPFAESYEFVGDRLGHDLRYAVSNYRANKAIGFELEHKGKFANTLDWYFNNQDWLNGKV